MFSGFVAISGRCGQGTAFADRHSPVTLGDVHSRIIALFVAAAAGLAAVTVTGCKLTSRTQARADVGAEVLFNGKDLTGWAGLPDHWQVEDGNLTGYTTAENPLKNNTFLVWTNGVVDNFELRFSYRIFHGNSGVQYRSALVDVEKFIVGGYQADFEAGQTYSGILYEERGRGILAERGLRTHIVDQDNRTQVQVLGRLADSAALQANIHDEDWNDYLIIADGNHVQHFINGRCTADVVDDGAKAPKSGIVALQIHVGAPMKVQFRNLKLKRRP